MIHKKFTMIMDDEVTLVLPDDGIEKLSQKLDFPITMAGAGSDGGVQMLAPGTALVVRSQPEAFGLDIARRLQNEGASADAALTLGSMADAGHSLGQWAARYMLVKVCGRSKNTLAAKTRNLATFIAWFVERNGSAAPGRDATRDGGTGANDSVRAGSEAGDIRRWTEAGTRYFLRHLEESGKRAATVSRALFTLKHFARRVGRIAR